MATDFDLISQNISVLFYFACATGNGVTGTNRQRSHNAKCLSAQSTNPYYNLPIVVTLVGHKVLSQWLEGKNCQEILLC